MRAAWRTSLADQRFEDRRQRHHWDVAEDLEQSSVLDLARDFPDLKLILSNWIGLDGVKLKNAGLKGRVLIDFARLHVLLHGDVGKLIDALGVEAIAFGSHMPFDYTAASLVKLSISIRSAMSKSGSGAMPVGFLGVAIRLCLSRRSKPKAGSH